MSIINFDSTDWNSIRDTIAKVNEIGCVQRGATSEGEDIIFDVHTDEDGNDVLHTTLFQKNGWERHNYYHPNEYIIEEVYKKS